MAPLVIWVVSAGPALAVERSDRVFDIGFLDHRLTIQQTWKVDWYFDAGNLSNHILSSFWFTSPSQPPNTNFVKQFGSAGTYVITDSPSGDTMKVRVAMLVSPSSGDCLTTFTLQAGTAVGGQRFHYRYSLRTPGGSWHPLLANSADLSIPYSAGAGCAAGTYQFRARSFLPNDHHLSSGFSKPHSVQISAP